MTTTTTERFDTVGAIIAYEDGTATFAEALELFAHLIRTGAAWRLQGCYGRTAATLIDAGYVSRAGEILIEINPEDWVDL